MNAPVSNKDKGPARQHFRRYIRICGILIERKTDVLAATAFLLSVMGMAYQVAAFMRGPHVVVFPTTQLLILPYSYSEFDTNECVRFAADFAYVNTGQAGYNAIITSEKIKYILGTNSYEQQWQSFESFTSTNDGKLISTSSTIVQFQAVNGGGSVNHETYFAPRSIISPEGVGDDRNFVTWNDFLDRLSKTNVFRFELISEIFETKKPIVKKMHIFVTDGLLKNLRKKGWTAAVCSED